MRDGFQTRSHIQVRHNYRKSWMVPMALINDFNGTYEVGIKKTAMGANPI